MPEVVFAPSIYEIKLTKRGSLIIARLPASLLVIMVLFMPVFLLFLCHCSLLLYVIVIVIATYYAQENYDTQGTEKQTKWIYFSQNEKPKSIEKAAFSCRLRGGFIWSFSYLLEEVPPAAPRSGNGSGALMPPEVPLHHIMPWRFE